MSSASMAYLGSYLCIVLYVCINSIFDGLFPSIFSFKYRTSSNRCQPLSQVGTCLNQINRIIRSNSYLIFFEAGRHSVEIPALLLKEVGQISIAKSQLKCLSACPLCQDWLDGSAQKSIETGLACHIYGSVFAALRPSLPRFSSCFKS